MKILLKKTVCIVYCLKNLNNYIFSRIAWNMIDWCKTSQICLKEHTFKNEASCFSVGVISSLENISSQLTL